MAKKKPRRKPGSTSQKLSRAAKKAASVADISLPAGLATAGALLSAGASTTGAALIGGAATLAASLIGSAFKFLVATSASRWQLWYAAYASGSTADPELVEAQLQEDAENPIVQELVVENARAIAEALTPSVLPVLARLTREYRSAGKGPDAFFRGMRRFLSELDEEECSVLRDLLRRVTDAPLPPDALVELIYFAFDKGQEPQLHAITTTLAMNEQRHPLGQFQHPLMRLFNLLKVNDLGRMGTSRWGVQHALSVIMHSDALRRMRVLFEQS